MSSELQTDRDFVAAGSTYFEFGLTTAILSALIIVSAFVQFKNYGHKHLYIPVIAAATCYLINGCLAATVGQIITTTIADQEPWTFQDLTTRELLRDFFSDSFAPISWLIVFETYRLIVVPSSVESPVLANENKKWSASMISTYLAYLWIALLLICEVVGLVSLSQLPAGSPETRVYQQLATSAKIFLFTSFGLWLLPVLSIIQAKISSRCVRPFISTFGAYQFLLFLVVIGRTMKMLSLATFRQTYRTIEFAFVDIFGLIGLSFVIMFGHTWTRSNPNVKLV
ncbi:hypothetical protein CLU79DRAFT_774692 [Phycomyces nitens]|nr:hypothetical protein CLU79DRAFT_774692 [Phycomyces nitens]